MKNPRELLRLSCALALFAGASFAQEPNRTALSSRCEGFPDAPAAVSALLELRFVDGNAARLELRGGMPGSQATVAVAVSTTAVPTLDHGCFDAEGCFVVPVSPASQHGTFVCQGYGLFCDLEGRWTMQASNGLRVEFASPVRPPEVPGAESSADVSLLRIELDSRRDGVVVDQIVAGDLVGALDTALNSHGDTLLAKVSGKVLIVVPDTPVQVGGSVAYTAKIARDNDEYLVTIGQDLAVLCGVKAASNIGVEGGVQLGGDNIYRFLSPAEVARGLIGIALQQALPCHLEFARGENLARVRTLRANIASVVATLDRLRSMRWCRRPAVERALDAVLGTLVAAHRHCRRAGDVLDRAAGVLCDEAQFVRDHTDGVELRFGTTGELSLKIGDKKLGGCVGAELGGKVNGGYQVTVRVFHGYREEAHRVEVLGAHVAASSYAAGIKLGSLGDGNERAYGRGFEISQKTTRGLRSVFERQGSDFGAPQVSIVIKREFGLLSFSRETAIEIDAAQLTVAGLDTVMALLDGDPSGALAAVLPITAHVAVQDKLTLALKPEFGVENTALTAKVAAECSWCDCGPLRQKDLTLADVVEHLLDVARVAAEVEQLVQDVLALPELQ